MLLFSSCERPGKLHSIILKGQVYLGGKIFTSLDLETKDMQPLYNGTELVPTYYPNFVSTDLFIVETIREEGMQIEYYNVKTEKFSLITKGIRPLYVSENNTLYYYKYEGRRGVLLKMILDGNNINELVSSDVYVATNDEFILQYDYPPAPLRVSQEEFVYYTKAKTIKIYNFINENSRIINVSEYVPYAYYSRKKALICQNKKDKLLYFIDIFSGDAEKLSIGPSWAMMPRATSGIIPIEEYECILYSKSSFFERIDTYIYRVKDRKEERYLKRELLTQGIVKK